MPPPPPPPPTHRPLTLIVATTPVLRSSTSTSTSICSPTTTSTTSNNDNTTLLGIGLNGTLPWPRIKSDMSFFARVTTRPPRDAPAGSTATNAIIMGRKTYDSLPKHLRPLAKRINVVITRDKSGTVRSQILKELEGQKQREREKLKKQQQEETSSVGTIKDGSSGEDSKPVTGALVATSLEDALDSLESLESLLRRQQQQKSLGNIFVIGGGEIYAAALRLPPDSPYGRGLRIVMTKVKKKSSSGSSTEAEVVEGFQCDAFFPLTADDLQNGSRWREVSAEEVSDWVGEPVSPEWKDEGDVAIKIVGYERFS
ncbi:hypothetical protein VTN77DRAFT_6186 [Rasamsonia byssochlamydoides]|uniref:uncharacterized protein n=1 Tax=Rasamsonia byssochlamydoides TaxID=89139 RepID=UPI0037430617